MNVGRAITLGMQEQARRDFRALAFDYRYRNYVLAYLWWGWDINGHGGLGRPGMPA